MSQYIKRGLSGVAADAAASLITAGAQTRVVSTTTSSATVKTMQTKLNQWLSSKIVADGALGPGTYAAMISFAKWYNAPGRNFGGVLTSSTDPATLAANVPDFIRKLDAVFAPMPAAPKALVIETAPSGATVVASGKGGMSTSSLAIAGLGVAAVLFFMMKKKG